MGRHRRCLKFGYLEKNILFIKFKESEFSILKNFFLNTKIINFIFSKLNKVIFENLKL